jgi:HK97 family phage prohead protease
MPDFIPAAGSVEQRINADPIEFHAPETEQNATTSPICTGYAYTFNSRSHDLGGFTETIERGAGTAALARDNFPALVNHDPSLILGRISAGTLRMQEDASGGRYEIDLPDTTYGRDLTVSLQRKDVLGSSFGFRVDPKGSGDEWLVDYAKGTVEHVVRQFQKIIDVGPVTHPAYAATTTSLRSFAFTRGLPLDAVQEAAIRGTLAELVSPQSDEARRYRNRLTYIR